jgi:phenylacetate-coenzyme A ligase PaaK-like adenylate-forming protein
MSLWRIQLAMVPSALCGQRLSRDELLALGAGRLRSVIAHACEHVAHYRLLFDRHGIRPCDIRTTADLRFLPITTKDDLRETPLQETLAHGISPASL